MGQKNKAINSHTGSTPQYFTMTVETPDTTAPTVSSVTPANNATNIAINGDIVITFDEAIAITGTVSLDGGSTTLNGGSFDAANKVFTIPYSGLDYSTLYTITIEGFEDAAGNEMTSNSSYTFTTRAIPDGPDVDPPTVNIDLKNGNTRAFYTTRLTTDDTVTVTGLRVVSGASLTVEFSDGDLATPTSIPVTVNVADSTPQTIYHTVTFNLTGGTHTGGGALVQSIADGNAATAPTTSRSGYTFTGWDKSFSNVTADMLLLRKPNVA